MRLIKRQTTNLRSIAGKGVQYDIDDQVIVDSERAMVVPKGPYQEQPGFAGDGTYPAVATGSTEGQIRYNTTNDELEAFQNGAWRNLRFKEPNQNPGIVQQNLGVGDATETVFGPLDSQDPDYPQPAAAQNVLVFIENVFQISGTNYTLEQSDGTNVPSVGPNPPYAAGWYIVFGSAPPLGKPITVLHNFDK
jgi:hypothetical protein